MINSAQPFNKFKLLNKSVVNKALTSATGIGEALIPQSLEQVITDTVIRLTPEMAVLQPKKITSKVHEFNRKTRLPLPGGAAGESSNIVNSNSLTVRDSVTIKIQKHKGVVTDFIADTSQQYIDAYAYEVENHLQNHCLGLVNEVMYGNKDAYGYLGAAAVGTWTQPTLNFDGLDKIIATNRIENGRGGVVPTSLKFLDDLIDKSNRKGGARLIRYFGMSPEMLSKVSRLLTNVRLNQDYGSGLTNVDIQGGWRMNAYRNIPIIETTSTRPIATTNVGTITASAGSTSTGGLSDGTYYFQVAAVTYEGEQLATAEQSITLSGGGSTQTIRLSFVAPNKDVAGYANALYYKIYMSSTTATEKLVKVASAFVYDSLGAALDPATDANCAGVGTNYIYITSLTPGTDVPTAMQADVPLVSTGGIAPEIVYLWCTDPAQGLGKFVYANTKGDNFNGMVTIKPLQEIEDYKWFLIKTYGALVPSYEATSAWVRNLRVE
jgi:hypothetical protein